MTSYFWTNSQQASERLDNSVVLYGNLPCYVQRVNRTGDEFENEGSVPTARCLFGKIDNSKDTTKKTLSLADEKFCSFRKLPPLGWHNNHKARTAFFGKRVIANTRTHGLSTRNSEFSSIDPETGVVSNCGYDISSIFKDEGFSNSCNGVFPSLNEILNNIAKGSSVAYSTKYCVFRNGEGVRFLYRNETKIGLFTGIDSFYLLENKGYFREEIQEDPNFTLSTIQEF